MTSIFCDDRPGGCSYCRPGREKENPMIVLKLMPHVSAAGYHIDRFDAYLDGELIVTSRQPIYAGARALIEQGCDPDQRLCGEWAGTGTKTMFGTIGGHARWTVNEPDRSGLKRNVWKPYPGKIHNAPCAGAGGTASGR